MSLSAMINGSKPIYHTNVDGHMCNIVTIRVVGEVKQMSYTIMPT